MRVRKHLRDVSSKGGLEHDLLLQARDVNTALMASIPLLIFLITVISLCSSHVRDSRICAVTALSWRQSSELRRHRTLALLDIPVRAARENIGTEHVGGFRGSGGATDH